MCKCLRISRSTYYYEASSKQDDLELETKIETIFHNNRDVYGSRKIKKELGKEGLQISRRRICRIMKKLGLVSSYTIATFRPRKIKCNESLVKNELNRNFNNHELYGVVVSDLTYVRVNYKWNYVCVLIDLYNREIIGFSAGVHKNAQLVYDAFATIKSDLKKIQMFHTDYAEIILFSQILLWFVLILRHSVFTNLMNKEVFSLLLFSKVSLHHQ